MPLVYPTAFFGQSQTLATALRFGGVNQRLQRTLGTGAGFNTVNRLDVSFSFWFRVPTLGIFNPIFTADSGTGGSWIYIDTDDCLKWHEANAAGLLYRTVNGTTPIEADTWHHGFVLLENAEAANQYAQIWLDGVRVSAGAQNQLATSFGLQTLTHSVGYHQNSSTFFNGDLAIFHWVDGAAMDSADFAGVIDGIYQAKEVTPTYDLNGSFLPFADPDNLGADFDNGWTYTLSNITAADLIGDGPPTSY
jgi:hypothetical protein